MKIDITIPVLNEESLIDKKIRELSLYITENLKDLGEFKIIIVDNGSDDSTKNKAESLVREVSGVEFIRLEKSGVGLALKSSWTNSNADIIGYMDLDLATDLKYLRPALLKLIAVDADIVTGSRLKSGAKVINRSLLRNCTSISFNRIVRILFGTSFTDGMCGFKFLRRDLLESLLVNGARNDGWFFATEILIVSEFIGYRIHDLPVTWTDDSDSKVKIIKLSIEYIWDMILLKRFLKKKRAAL